MDLSTFNFEGIIVGAFSFLIIGIYHPLVIKGEYYLGKNVWWSFLFVGIISIILSILVNNKVISIFLGVNGFAALWGIKEIFEQVERVKVGRFPKNPRREYE